MDKEEEVLGAKCKMIVELSKSLGFPVIVSFALLYAAWHLGGQLVESHQHFISALASESQRHSNLLEQIAKSQQETSVILRAIYREAVHQSEAPTVGIPSDKN